MPLWGGGRARITNTRQAEGRAARPTTHRDVRCLLDWGGSPAGTTTPPPQRASRCARAARRGGQCAWLARASRCATGWPRSRGGNRGRTTTPKRVCRLAQCGWLNKAPRTGSVLTFERSGGERIDHATLRRRVNHPHLIWSAQNSHLCRGPQADSRLVHKLRSSAPPLRQFNPQSRGSTSGFHCLTALKDDPDQFLQTFVPDSRNKCESRMVVIFNIGTKITANS